ncbi:MAG: ABC transporter ATP-binding protein [Clostridia bacterium]|nr:ABC transporter ATP-binding protein [Clostridia bacterium]
MEKTYGTGANKVPVLHDVNLKVEAGEYIAIMGPSGSGKSTLMNILGYLDVPTSGVYRFDGQDNAKAGDARMARIRNEKIGFVFQSFHLMQRRRAWENVALPLMYGNVKRSERKRRAEEALNQVGLGDRINFYPNQLSGGQCQRVAIARAICTRPRLLLADEPTGALDSKAGQQIMDIFDELHDQGMTIVMITHEHAVAERARKMLYIYDGWLREEAGA